jgi:hypothetical protein
MRLHVITPPDLGHEPLGNLVGEPAGADTADEDADLEWGLG